MRVTLNIDGGARGNPGPAAAAFVIRAAGDGAVLRQRGIFLGKQTNNVAEYRALLAGLEAAAELGASEVEVVSDSELLVRQMNGRYRVRNEDLKKLFDEALALQGKFSACTYRHVRREQNAPPDRLVNQAINLKRNVTGDDD